MIQRAALLLASLVAALSLAVGLAAAGLAPRPTPVGTGATAPALEATDPTAPTVQTDTVYLPAPVEPQDVTVHRVVQAGGHGDDEGEGGEDD